MLVLTFITADKLKLKSIKKRREKHPLIDCMSVNFACLEYYKHENQLIGVSSYEGLINN